LDVWEIEENSTLFSLYLIYYFFMKKVTQSLFALVFSFVSVDYWRRASKWSSD